METGTVTKFSYAKNTAHHQQDLEERKLYDELASSIKRLNKAGLAKALGYVGGMIGTMEFSRYAPIPELTDRKNKWLKAGRLNRKQQRIQELAVENRALHTQLNEKEKIIDVIKKAVGTLSKP